MAKVDAHDVKNAYLAMKTKLDQLDSSQSIVAMFTRCQHFSGMFVDFERCWEDEDYRRQTLRHFIDCIFVETAEALEKLNWKNHHDKSRGDDIEAFIEELVDIQHFLFNALLTCGKSPSDFMHRFVQKNEINWERKLIGRDLSDEYDLT